MRTAPLLTGTSVHTRLLTAGGALLFLAAPVYLLATGHSEVKTSSDAGAPTMSLLTVMAPVTIGLVLTWLVPPRTPALEPPVVRPARESVLLVVLAALFPASLGALVLAGGEPGGWYALAKLVLFLAVPLTVLAVLRRRPDSPPRQRWRGAWRWWMPLPAVAVWAYVAYLSPLRHPPLSPENYPDLVETAIIASLTFLTASVLEEVFFRIWLQTRLEARLGRVPGIIAASLLFAAMHLPTHHPHGDPVANVANALAFQGVFGLFVGSLWSRYRNPWTIIAVHTVTNSASLIPLYL